MKKALALTVFALCLAGPALAQSAGQTAASSSLGVREIAEADMNGYVAKSNAVVGLLNTSLRASGATWPVRMTLPMAASTASDLA